MRNSRTLVTVTVAISLTTIFALRSIAAEPGQAAKPAKKGTRPGADVSTVKPARDPDRNVVFKKTPQGELKLFFYFPKDWKADDKRPAIVFWFGGGFVGGTPAQFYAQAEYLAARGLVCVCAEYRIKSTHGTGIDKCVEDARSAMRWVKQRAGELGIDPNKVIAAGGSAGGTLALLVTLGSGPDAKDDNTALSPKPCAMVLFNPAQGEAVSSRIEVPEEDKARVVEQMSSLNIAQRNQPPAIFFFGADDRLLVASRNFCEQSLKLGNRCELWTAAGQAHGFFNREPWHTATLRKADEFLTSLGYLQGAPTIKVSPQATLQQELPESKQ